MLLDFASRVGKKLAPIVVSGAKKTFLLVGGGVSYLYYDQHVGGLRRVIGPSMVPTFNLQHFHDPNIFERENISSTSRDIIYFSRDFSLSRGDVVYLINPRTKNSYIVKRVLGLPGDTVKPLGVVKDQETESVTLSEGQVWVESDAGLGYADSNLFGPVNITNIKGKIQWAIRPNLSSFNVLGFRQISSDLSQDKLARVKFV